MRLGRGVGMLMLSGKPAWKCTKLAGAHNSFSLHSWLLKLLGSELASWRNCLWKNNSKLVRFHLLVLA